MMMPNIPLNYNINNINNLNNNNINIMNPIANVNFQPINFQNNFNNNINLINPPNNNIIFPNNNLNSSLNIIKSTFLNEDEDFGEPMTFQQIDNLPIINYPNKDNNDEKCTLCEFPFCYNDRVTKLEKCQHTFHKECLGNFLLHNKASKCPICKVSLI